MIKERTQHKMQEKGRHNFLEFRSQINIIFIIITLSF